MRFNRIKNFISVGSAVAILLLGISLASAQDAQTFSRAQKSYQQGVNSFNEQRLRDAERHFVDSYRAIPHPLTAYFLSLVFSEQGILAKTEDFAEKALHGSPPLKEPFRTGAKEIKAWAKREKKVTLDGKADQPRSAPPKAVIPHVNSLRLSPQSMLSVNLTGIWRANDGGKYFIRQLGSEVWWYGLSGDGGKSWTNVFHGTIKGKRLTGHWADVPQGKSRNFGKMKIKVLDAKRLKATHKTGGFGGSEWNR